MSNPALNEKKFEEAREEWQPGWGAAAPDTVMQTQGQAVPPAAVRGGTMTANGTFAKTFALFLLVLVGGVVGWTQTDTSLPNQIEFPAWTWICLIGAFGLALVCAFKPKASPYLGPLYALLEGVFLGAISKVFEAQWDGIVFQAILATIGVFFATLALYVFGVVKVTRKFQMVVIGATAGIFLLYVFGALMSLFGVDVTFWNEPSALGIIVSIVIACVAALNLFLDYEFIRQASLQGSPKYMEWYGAFGIMVTLVWLYLEILRLLALLRD
jgi:uncharacterized YccA/Bax inhibitor family protein